MTYDGVLKALTTVRGAQRVTDQDPEGKYQTLEKYGTDLTARAQQGKIDPVIGRDDEIRRVMQVLSPPHEEQSRCSSASPAWARPPSSKASRGASSPATCRNR